MISFESSGSFGNLEAYLKKASKNDIIKILDKYGKLGVAALSSATPLDSGKTSTSWDYETSNSKGSFTITWINTNTAGGPLAIMLQLGHGTGTGGYVQGRDYINPAMKPIFDKLEADVWREVANA